MATERIDIIVSERGSRTVRREIEGIGNSARGAEGAVSLLRRALGAIAVGAIARQLAQLTDQYTNLQNRLRTVVSGTQQLNVVTKELLSIANSTRQSFTGTAEVYARVGLAAKELGVSQSELLNFTESLNQAIVLSGASAQEAEAGMIQLAQGMASGRLQGDELRSVLENLPVVADVIAKHLGVTRGELRQMGQEGKITADIILAAFRGAREELAGRFAEAVPTIGQAFTVLRNNLTALVGEWSTNSGLASGFANIVLMVANNVDVLARAALAAAMAIGTVLAAQAIPRAITAIRMLTVAIAANPFGAIAVAITTIVSLLVSFSDQIRLSGDSMANLQDLAVAVWQTIQQSIQSVVQWFSTNFGWVATLASQVFGDVEFSIAGVLKVAASVVDGLIGAFVGAFRAIVAAFSNLPAALRDIFSRAMNGAISLVESGVNKIIGALNTVLGAVGIGTIGNVALGRVANVAEGAASNWGKAVGDAFRSGFEFSGATEAVEGLLNRAESVAQERIAREQQRASEEAAARAALGVATGGDLPGAGGGGGGGGGSRGGGGGGGSGTSFSELLAQLQRENELLALNNREREVRQQIMQFEEQLGRRLTESEAAQVAELVRANQALEMQQQVLQEIQGPKEDLIAKQEAINELYRQGKISVDEYAMAMRNLQVELTATSNTLAGGIMNGLSRVAQQANNLGSAVSDWVVGSFNQATDAIVNFAKTGELNIRELFASIFENLLRLALNQLWAQLIGMFLPGFGGGGGGLLGGLLGGLPGFQTGGSFTVGGSGGPDSQLVAFRASPNERVDVLTPQQQAAQQQAMQGGGQPVNVRVVNVTDPRESLSALDTAEGERVIMNVIERNPAAFRRILGAT